MKEQDLIPKLFKTEYSKIIAVLCNLFGIKHIKIAEDITNDTFLLASETWGLKGIPENPTAWLYTVAKNKTRDYLKRNKLFAYKISVVLKTQPSYEELDIDLSTKNIKDSQLQMLFAVCNPTIPIEAQIGLALKVLCGFGIEEIANAFLTNKETINKRLYRAKEKLRTEKIKFELPNDKEIQERLNTVLSTLYLLFNEGYNTSSQHKIIQKELCLEAMRLCYLLLENEFTNKPITNALMSLLSFHASRFEARINANNEAILYEEQDKNLWNEDLIAKGNYYLIASAKGNEISKYHLEASIAYWHCTKTENSNKWDSILQLYNQLLQIEYSPIAALNRTYALAQVKGKQFAIVEAEKLNLKDNHFYFALLGYLYTEIDKAKALDHFEKAYQIASKDVDKKIITQKIVSLK